MVAGTERTADLASRTGFSPPMWVVGVARGGLKPALRVGKTIWKNGRTHIKEVHPRDIFNLIVQF